MRTKIAVAAAGIYGATAAIRLLRVVEDNPEHDRRTLYMKEGAPGEFHIFSGKVVGAVRAARQVSEAISSRV